MEILLVLLWLTSVLGDKLNHGYLPPPGAHLSAGDLNYNDLPFALPDSSYTEYAIPGDNDSVYIESQDNESDVSSTTSPLTTTISQISEYFTPSTTTVTDFTYDITESNNSQQKSLIMEKSLEEVLPARGIEEKYFSSPISSLSFQEPKKIENHQVSNMAYNYPNTNSNRGVDILNNQNKYSLNPLISTLTSARKIVYANNDRNSITTNQKYNLGSDGFSYDFDTSNGMHVDVSGTGTSGIKSKGTFSYIGDDGRVYKMEYTADENGFQPRGAHLPTPPPIPKEIQEVIKQANRNKAAGIFDDGSYSEDKYGYKNYMPGNDKTKKQNKITKNTMIQPSDTFGEYNINKLHRPNVDNIMTDRNRMIPVQVIYDQGYNYDQPQMNLHLPTIRQPEYSSSEAPQIDDENSENVNHKSTETDIYQPTDVNINDSNLFRPNEHHSSENLKTTNPILPTYGMIFNKLQGDSSLAHPEIVTKFPTTATPFYLENEYTQTYKSRFLPGDNEVMISTATPVWVTEATPRTEAMPAYLQTQRGEDFSGPKQLPTYNSETGYHY